jgi:IS5 family transposase
MKVKKSWKFQHWAAHLHGGIAMRLAFDPQRRLDCPPIEEVKLNLNCRDEIIPILRALQHIYSDGQRRREILDVVGKDVNRTSSRKHGRPGMDYWQIIVLAAVRLGCNLDYDKLQDLAEQHRNLRLLMGIGDWQEEVDFDWRRIQDNLTHLRPETLKKINQAVVATGHELKPKAVEAVRGDTFVVETNIHHPTESTLIGDGLRKVVKLAAALAEEPGLPGWRQHEHWLKNIRKLVQKIGRASRAKGQGSERLRPGYEELLARAKELLERARQLVADLSFRVEPAGELTVAQMRELLHYVTLTEKVCDNARRRVLEEETVANSEKIFSIFEPHTELIKRGKQPVPIQFGHNVLVIEDAVGFIAEYEVVANGVLDQDLVVPAMTRLQKRLQGKIKHASFDRAFHTPENQEKLAEIVRYPCIPEKGQERGRRQQEGATVAFRKARKNHPGVESAINALQTGNGQKRCRDKSKRGFERYVGLGILGRNLQVLGKLLLAQDEANCQAAQTKRKETG